MPRKSKLETLLERLQRYGVEHYKDETVEIRLRAQDKPTTVTPREVEELSKEEAEKAMEDALFWSS
jgi:hypothetical protein